MSKKKLVTMKNLAKNYEQRKKKKPEEEVHFIISFLDTSFFSLACTCLNNSVCPPPGMNWRDTNLYIHNSSVLWPKVYSVKLLKESKIGLVYKKRKTGNLSVTHFRNAREKGKGEEKAEIIQIPPPLVEQLYKLMKRWQILP